MNAQAAIVPPGETFVKNLCYIPVSPAFWRKDQWPFFDYRDLGLHGASMGTMRAEHVRFTGSPGDGTGWYSHNLAFDWIYVLKGSVSVAWEGGGTATLKADDAILLRAGFGVKFCDFSSDYEAVEIAAPAKGDLTSYDTPPSGSPADLQPVINFDSRESHVVGEGLRRFFSYRDFGMGPLTNGMIQLHVITVAEQPPGGTGWHVHKAGQFAYVLDGWATVALKNQAPLHYRAGDALSVCPGYGHDVPEFSMKYKVIELIAPAEYDTVAID